MSAITHAELTANAPPFMEIMNEHIPRAFLHMGTPWATPLDWNTLGLPHITNTWAHLGDCIGAIAAYMNADLGMPPPDIENAFIQHGIYNSSFLSAHPSMTGKYTSTGQAFDPTWWNGNGFSKSNWSIPNLEQVFGFIGTIDAAIQTGVYTPSGGGGGGGSPPPPAGPTPGTGPQAPYTSLNLYHNQNRLLEPDTIYPSMCGFTSYNKVEGHFFLKKLPNPIESNVSKTVQGISDRFEAKFEDMGVGSLVETNDKADITQTVYQGEGLQTITQSTISQYEDTTTTNKVGAIISQQGKSYSKVILADNDGSMAETIISIRVDDIRPFALKGLDLEHEAHFDYTNGIRPTNRNYIRHLSPEKESRIATIETPFDLQQMGGPSKVLVHYNAIDLTGEVMGGTQKAGGIGSHDGLFDTPQNKWSDMSFNSANSDKWEFDGSGWLVVEKTIPDANTFYYDPDGTPRSLADWLRKPYRNSTPNTTPLKINAPGGLISIPTKDINKPIQSNELLINPTGETTQSPFINIESTPRGVAFTGHLGSYTGEGLEHNRPMGLPIALSNTRSPVKQSEGAYHTLSIDIKQKEGKATTPTMIKNQFGADIRKTLPNVEPVVLEQFDIIDNLVMNDRHLLLIHPKQRSRTNTLSTLKSKEDEPTKYHRCNVELMMLRGRVEEIVPTGGEEGEVNGVLLRGRSLVRDIADSVSNRDFNLAEGSPMKEIGDIGSPVVSLTMGGLGQGGIDIKATRKENPHLSGWKDVIMSANNPSVRNDKQTSTYYASTRALVEIPLFPSMFFDTQKRLISSKNKNSPLPAANALEMVIDATMTAANRPQMQHQESKYAIDWGLDSNISAIRVNDYIAQANKGIRTFRCFRENAATYTKPSASWSATESTVAAGSANITDWQNGLAYIEVDSVLPFIQEGGQKYTTPTGGGSYAPTSPAFQDPLQVIGGMEYNGGDAEWTLTQQPSIVAEPDGKGFVVTVGEGILGDWGIRLFIHKVAIVGNSHRLYYGAFHNPLDNTSSADPTQSNFVGHFISSGLPVVMGGWLTGAAFNTGAQTAWNLDDLTFDGGTTDALSLVKKIGRSVEMLFGMRLGNDGKARVMLDPKDSNTILIKDGPSMEGMQLDPMHYYYGADDMPLRPPIELIPSYLGLKGKKNDNLTLDHVQKMHINFGEVATNVDDFKQGVNEVIRLINQAAHPNATNTNGGSAFNPPALFSQSYSTMPDDGFYATSSIDTGSHMGYVRAFEGKEVESRDGESGMTIVIHSTIPGASSRNFAIWFNNNSPYGYRPQQAIGSGGLLTTNSRSYQINSFPAPLPIGADGETHVPITTFTGAVVGSVETQDNKLRLYEGIGQELTFFTVKNPRYNAINPTASAELLPDYDPDTQATLWVDRDILEMLNRANHINQFDRRGLILVDGKHLATFGGVSTFSAPFCKVSGPGACAALEDVQPYDPKVKEKFKDLFYDKDGRYQRVEIQLLSPMIDAHGILFFGGGHTGITFDVSDGTDNDYSDFYTHHYSKGPTGYSGLQNVEEIQKSAAVLDFTKLNNQDTAKANSYAGMHYKDDDCIAYIRFNNDGLPYIGDPDGNGGPDYGDDPPGSLPVMRPVENKYGLQLGMIGDFSHDLLNNGTSSGSILLGDNEVSAVGKPLYKGSGTEPEGDISARGIHWDMGGSGHKAISLSKIPTKASAMSYPVPTIPPRAGDILAQGPWSITFCFKPSNATDTTWQLSGYGNGPVLHGIDNNGAPWGVSILSRQYGMTGVGDANAQFDYRIVVHHKNSAASGEYHATWANGVAVKDGWRQITVVKPLDGTPIIYDNGVAMPNTETAGDYLYGGSFNTYPLNNDATYLAGQVGMPRLAKGLGTGTNANPLASGSTYYGRYQGQIVIGAALHGVPMVISPSGLWGTIKELADNTTIQGGFWTVAQLQYGNNNLNGQGGSQTAGSLTSHARTYFKGQLAELGLWAKALSVDEAMTIGQKNWGV